MGHDGHGHLLRVLNEQKQDQRRNHRVFDEIQISVLTQKSGYECFGQASERQINLRIEI